MIKKREEFIDMNDQGSLFPPSDQDKSVLIWGSIKDAFELRVKVEVLERYWRSFFQEKIIDWQKKENKELKTLYPNYTLEGFQFSFEDCDHLELRFFLPTLEEINAIGIKHDQKFNRDY